jgi:CheY-like chemotaxis protein
MEQVILNLIVNARDAMPKGGALTIRTEDVELDPTFCATHLHATPGRYILLSVSDSGYGMTEDVQARMFEPFFTTKERGKGTGLGLSTVYGIIEQSQGSIWVYSEPDVGTTFKIYLPVAADVAEPISYLPIFEADAKNSATILLVEDDPAVRRMTSLILVRSGYTVLEADGAESARRLCSQHSGAPELLLTDVIMPKTNGRELAQELQLRYPAMKVLYMSGYTDDVITRNGVLDHGVAFIEKPFTPKSITAKIRDVIGGGKPQDAAQGATAPAN